MARRYRHPLHPFLVHIPIGAWVCSLVFDIAGRFAAKPAFLAEGAAWLIAIGVIGAVVAAGAGLFDLAAIHPGRAAFQTARTHMVINVGLTFAYAGNLSWRLGHHHLAASVGPGILGLSAASVVALGVSGYLGGKLTYRYGVRVAPDSAERPVSAGRASR